MDSEPDRLRHALLYLMLMHPNPTELTQGRLASLLFLADWRSAIEHGRQITGRQWRLVDVPAFPEPDHQWPPEDQGAPEARAEEPLWHALSDSNKELFDKFAGVSTSWLGSTIVNAVTPTLNDQDRTVLDFAIQATSNLTLQDLSRLVRSIYPAVTQPPQAPLDLVELAEQYRVDREMFLSPPEGSLTR